MQISLRRYVPQKGPLKNISPGVYFRNFTVGKFTFNHRTLSWNGEFGSTLGWLSATWTVVSHSMMGASAKEILNIWGIVHDLVWSCCWGFRIGATFISLAIKETEHRVTYSCLCHQSKRKRLNSSPSGLVFAGQPQLFLAEQSLFAPYWSGILRVCKYQ